MTVDRQAARIIAFYLPQYHPTPENSAWWGEGFTDWLNVVRATPVFPGHQQPDLPSELGFYDLRLAATREAQADLARAHGIHGFCYYHYWFGGRRLLSQPLDEMLSSGTPDFPFCLCWANENWTRVWDGFDDHVLMNVVSTPEDDRAHMTWLAHVFEDPRYIRVDGKPILLIYRLSKLANPARTTAVWREEAHRLGIGEIFLASVESQPDDRVDPAVNGFDASVEFQPDWLCLGAPAWITADGTKVFSYQDVVERMRQKPGPSYRRFGGVTTGWDNTPRRRQGAVVLDGSRPELYEGWLRSALATAKAPGTGEALVFVNAWNEWAEGAHLEPCQRWGRAYLEATRRAVQSTAATPAAPKPPAAVSEGHRSKRAACSVSVCVPICGGETHLRSGLQSILSQSYQDFELILVDDASTDRHVPVLGELSDPRVRSESNATRLGLVGTWNRCLDLARGEFVCLFDPHDLMSPANLMEKVRILRQNPGVGMVHSNANEIATDGSLLASHLRAAPDPGAQEVESGRRWFARLLTGMNDICRSSVVMRRESLLDVGAFDPTLSFAADWEMWMRLSLFFDVGYLAAPLVSWRRRKAGDMESVPGDGDPGHDFAAKWKILTKYADRIPGVESLRSVVAAACTRQAIELAAHSIVRGESRKAIAYIEAAAAIQDVACDASDGRTRPALLRMLEDAVGSTVRT